MIALSGWSACGGVVVMLSCLVGVLCVFPAGFVGIVI